MQKLQIEKLAIIGVGLMGGSIALSLKKKGYVGEVTGVGRGIENLKKALDLGIIDKYTLNLEDGVRDADVVVVAIPVGSIVELIAKSQGYMKDGAIITDVGSVKGEVVKGVEKIIDKRLDFVGGHPIAGTEESGAGAAFPTLYEGSKCILTPSVDSREEAFLKIRDMWEATGAEVVVMGTEDHDKILAAISHLPHVIAYSLVNTVNGIDDFDKSILSYSAGGFRDFTRIASSSPEMWRDICSMNRDAIIDMIDRYMLELSNLRTLIEEDARSGMLDYFNRSKKARDSLL